METLILKRTIETDESETTAYFIKEKELKEKIRISRLKYKEILAFLR